MHYIQWRSRFEKTLNQLKSSSGLLKATFQNRTRTNTNIWRDGKPKEVDVTLKMIYRLNSFKKEFSEV